MKGDFTKAVFDPLRRFVRVLLQQGRVTVDADAQEPPAGTKPPAPAPAANEAADAEAEIRKPH
jgi:hypothetical protein